MQHNIRPTAFSEIAKAAGFGLGAVTALMGKEAAMACTEAVETVIGEHYDECVFVLVMAERVSEQWLQSTQRVGRVLFKSPKYSPPQGSHSGIQRR